MTLRNLLLGSALVVAAAPAMAETMAMASTDLNYRAGPGVGFEVLGVIPADSEVTVVGCMTDSQWCEVNVDGTMAYAYGDYLMATEDSMALRGESTTAVEVQTVTYEPANSDSEAALALGAAGAAAGYILGGPAGIATGIAAGLLGGPVLNPDGEVVTYVTANPIDPVYAEGEVVVGATLSDNVTLYDTPSDEVRYVNLNGQYVLVEPTERQIVYVVR